MTATHHKHEGEAPYQVSTRHNDDSCFIQPVLIHERVTPAGAADARLAKLVGAQGVHQALVTDARGKSWVFNVAPPVPAKWSVELAP